MHCDSLQVQASIYNAFESNELFEFLRQVLSIFSYCRRGFIHILVSFYRLVLFKSNEFEFKICNLRGEYLGEVS